MSVVVHDNKQHTLNMYFVLEYKQANNPEMSVNKGIARGTPRIFSMAYYSMAE